MLPHSIFSTPPNETDDQSDDQSPEARIRAARVWHLYRMQPVVIINHLLLAPFTVFGIWGYAAHNVVFGWLAATIGIQLLRAAVTLRFRRHPPPAHQLMHWARLIAVFSTLNGLIWGATAPLFLDTSEPLGFMIITTTIIATAAGALGTSSPYAPSFWGYLFSSVGTLSIFLLLQNEPITTSVAGLCLLTMFGLSNIHLLLNRTINQALQLSFENQALRRRAERQTRLFETTLQSVNQGIAAQDPDGRLTMWNSRFDKLLPLPGIKRGIDLEQGLTSRYRQLPLTGGEFWRGDRYLELETSETGDGGRVITVTDITTIKQRQQAIEDARQEAERANVAKTRFLAAASHDLRQPIHALGLFFATLADRIRGPDTAMLIDRIETAINSINTMLETLLDISKLDAGVIQANIRPVSLDPLMQRLADELTPAARDQGLTLTIRPTTVWVNSDPVLLERVMRNLLINALRYTDHGRVLVAARRRGETIEWQVWDTGIGIPADQLEAIFQEFHQLANRERDRSQGLGLGLAIVQRTASLLGHAVTVRSVPGRGSCFSLRMPRAVRQASTSIPSPSPVIGLGQPTILVVDDDPEVLDAMGALLRAWDCRVLQADGLDTALVTLSNSRSPPDLLIVDYRLPDDMTGDRVISALQQQIGTAVAALIVTGDTGPKRLRDAGETGYPVLHKPIDPARLRSAIQLLTRDRDNR